MEPLDPETLWQELKPRLADRSQVVGSQLGSFIKEILPDVDFRAMYGGLRPFVLNNLGPYISWTGKSGLDDLYNIGGEPGEDADTLASGLVTASTSDELWQIFANPNHPGDLFVNVETGELFIAKGGGGENQLDLRPIQTLTPEQQKGMVRDWLEGSQRSEDERTQLDRILGGENYWWKLFNWFAAGPTEIRESWTNYRYNRIRQLFATALTEAGVSKENILALSKLLLKSKKKTKPKHAKSTSTVESAIEPGCTLSAHSLKSLARECVGRLSESQLREIQLPLGVVWDVLKDSNE